MITLKNNCLALIGMTGSGKTSVGRIVASRIGACFVDLDAEIVARHGEIRTIFDEQGEEAFRRIECETLSAILQEKKESLCVIACGGGLPVWYPSRKLLCGNATVIWLKRGLHTVKEDSPMLKRPPINGDLATYKKLLTKRYPLYRASADFAVYNSYPQRTAKLIVKKLEEMSENQIKGEIEPC